MTLKIYDRYGPNANPPDADYPQGSFKNASTPTATDGTPVEADWANDRLGFTDWLISKGGVTRSEVPDTVLASDRGDALTNIFARPHSYQESGYSLGEYTVIPYRSTGFISKILDGDVISVFINTTLDVSAGVLLNVADKTGASILESNGEPVAIRRLIQGATCFFRYVESSNDFIIISPREFSQEIVFEHAETVGTDGGDMGGITPVTRPITFVRHSDYGSGVAAHNFDVILRGAPTNPNSFKPAIGTYKVYVYGVFGHTDGCRQWLYNLTTTSDIPNSYSTSGEDVGATTGTNAPTIIRGRFYFNGTDSIQIKAQHTIQSNPAVYGFGEASSIGGDEIYMRARFKRISFYDVT
jgi:hypothetical protein